MYDRLHAFERRARTLSGVVIGVFVTLHLAYQIAAIHSLDAAEAVRRVLSGWWWGCIFGSESTSGIAATAERCVCWPGY